MPTQQEIAEHLGINQSEVSRHMAALGVDWRNETMSRVRLAYLEHLRAMAAGHRASDGTDLTYERAQTERVDRQLKELQLAERKGQLINVAQLEPALARQYLTFKAELEARDDKLAEELHLLYGIDVDIEIIASHTRNALSHLTGLASGGGGAADAPAPPGRADAAADDDPVGDAAADAVAEGHGQTG